MSQLEMWIRFIFELFGFIGCLLAVIANIRIDELKKQIDELKKGGKK